jgi:hypothetical protein
MFLFSAFHHLPPPGQAHQRQHRLACHFARPRQLMVEGIQQQQPVALRRGGEQAAKKTVRIGSPHMRYKRA